jgi:hypothetical protein
MNQSRIRSARTIATTTPPKIHPALGASFARSTLKEHWQFPRYRLHARRAAHRHEPAPDSGMRGRCAWLRSLDQRTHICCCGRDVLARVDRDGRPHVPVARSVDHTQTDCKPDVTVVGGHEVEVTFQ